MLPALYEKGLYPFEDPAPLLEHVRIVDTLKGAKELSEELVTRDFVAIDTEFDDVIIKKQNVCGRGTIVTSQFAWHDDDGEVRTAWVDCRNSPVLDGIRPFLQHKKKNKIIHNFPIEAHAFANHGIRIQGFAGDTLQLARLEDPEKGRLGMHKLDGDQGLAIRVLGLPPGSRPGTVQALGTFKIGVKGQPTKQIKLLPMSELVEDDEMRPFQQVYSVQDASDALRVYPYLVESLKRMPVDGHDVQNLYDFYCKYYLRYQPLLWRMERRGVAIDVELMQWLSARFGARMEELLTEFYRWAGCSVNMNSPPQKSHLFYGDGWKTLTNSKGKGKDKTIDILGHGLPIPPEKNAAELDKWEESGQIRGDEEAITWLIEEADLSKKDKEALVVYQEYSKLSKLKSTYTDKLPTVNALPGHVSGFRTIPTYPAGYPADMFIHGQFNLGQGRTGRLSSSNPNLQNIPTRTRLGELLRHAFIAAYGCSLLVADYSQIELRVLAYYTLRVFGDSTLWDDLSSGDLHQQTADRLSDLLHRKIERDVAKSVNFGIVYGITYKRLMRVYGLSEHDARMIIDSYTTEIYPAVQLYQDWAINMCRTTGAARTLFGRYRFLPDINARYRGARARAERQAMNTPIQGSAQDIVMMAQLNLEEDEELQELGYAQIIQVHDELVGESPIAMRKRALERKIHLMENVIAPEDFCGIRLVVEGHTGQTWGEAKKGTIVTVKGNLPARFKKKKAA